MKKWTYCYRVPAIQQIFGVSDHQRSDPYASKIQNFQIQVMWTSQNTRNEDRIKTSQIYSFLSILPEMAEDGGCDPLNHQCNGEEIGGRRRRQRKSWKAWSFTAYHGEQGCLWECPNCRSSAWKMQPLCWSGRLPLPMLVRGPVADELGASPRILCRENSFPILDSPSLSLLFFSSYLRMCFVWRWTLLCQSRCFKFSVKRRDIYIFRVFLTCSCKRNPRRNGCAIHHPSSSNCVLTWYLSLESLHAINFDPFKALRGRRQCFEIIILDHSPNLEIVSL